MVSPGIVSRARLIIDVDILLSLVVEAYLVLSGNVDEDDESIAFSSDDSSCDIGSTGNG